MEVTTPPTGGSAELLGWIIGILILTLAGLFTYFKLELKSERTRFDAILKEEKDRFDSLNSQMNKVMDDSISRMERKNERENQGMDKMREMISTLKEIIIISKNGG